MKILLLFFACFAAVNANFYQQYFYRYGYTVYPQSSSYAYTVYYLNVWTTTNYYSPILKVYPGETCGTAGWEEKEVADVKTEIENLLKEQLMKIAQEMINRRDAFMATVDNLHARYRTYYVNSITRYYAYLIAVATTDARKQELEEARDEAIRQYIERLEAYRASVLTRYNEIVANKLEYIAEYQAKLCKNAENCLNTRKENISKYCVDLTAYIESWIAKYVKYHTDILASKTAYYRNLLYRVHGSSSWELEKVNALVDAYNASEMTKIDELKAKYMEQLTTCKDQLITYYSCANRCYLCNGCYYYYKQYFLDSRSRLGKWWTYRITYTTLSYSFPKSSLTWRKVIYRGLQECDVDAVNPPVENIGDDFIKKCQEYVDSYRTLFTAWKEKWETYYNEYLEIYRQVVTERMDFYVRYYTAVYQVRNNSLDLTPEQQAYIEQMRAEKLAQMEADIAEYRNRLAASIVECTNTFEETLTAYKESLTNYLEEYKARYQKCLDDRTAAIEAYKIRVDDYVKEMKDALEIKSAGFKSNNLKCYEAMLKMFHGETLPAEATSMLECYEQLLQERCTTVMTEFETYYGDLASKLVMHYACTYVCSTRAIAILPRYTFGSYYTWTVNYPTFNTYSYILPFYTRYRYFRVVYYSSRRQYVIVF